MIVPRARYPAGEPRRILILEHGRNPTTDYFFRPRLSSLGPRLAEVVDISCTSPSSVPVPDGTFVIIVRYLNDAWARYLRHMKPRFCRVVYFVDDDLPAAFFSLDLPLRYRYKIFRLFVQQRATLSSICSEVCVSTPGLAEKYGLDDSSIIPPLPAIDTGPSTRASFFYAGTASHQREFRWLRSLVGAVQDRSRDLTFVTFGGGAIQKLFRGIPRVLCIHPVPWPTFVASLPIIRLDIGLAPLLSGAFNEGRSPTKFFDITRLGAAGLYSDVAPYTGFVRPEVDGCLLQNDIEQWCSSILDLAEKPERREALLKEARARVRSLERENPQNFP